MSAGVNLVPGQKVTAVVLHIDLLSTCVHASILSRLLGKKKLVRFTTLVKVLDFYICICSEHFLGLFWFFFKQLNEGSKYTATVEHISQDFAVIALDNTAQLTVIQTSSHLNHMPLSDTQELKLGMSLTVEVIEASCQEAQGLPLVSWERSLPKRQHTTSDRQKGYRFGEIVQGKVKLVKPTVIQVTLGDGTTGSVHVSEVIEAKDVCQGYLPTFSVKAGSTITARVIGGREASSHR